MSSLTLKSNDYKVIILSSLGGALEFYDFIIYVFWANEFTQLFFPQRSHFMALISVYAVFAVGYLIRPLGGLVFSHFGDKYGRKITFLITLMLMAIPTFCIGLLPTYQTVGLLAPALLILLRIMQGLSVGGEIPGAITFAAEHVPAKHRGLTCAIIFFGVNVGLITGSGINLLINTSYTQDQILAYAWRIPFLIGGLLGIVSFYLRKNLTETPIFQINRKQDNPKFPIIELLKYHRLEVFQGISLTWLDSVIVCLLFLYLPNYLTTILHFPKDTISLLNTMTIILHCFIFLYLGFLSDKYGRRIFLQVGSFGFALLGYGLFYLLAKEQMAYLLIVEFAVAVLSACITGVYTCAIVESFPTHVRYTGMAISYNIGFAFFGGLTPLIATTLIKTTGNILSPSFYLIISAVACCIGASFITNRHKQNLC